MPPEPAGINTFWPGRSFARSLNAADVSPTIGMEAACTKSRFDGLSAAAFSGTTANSASAPVPRSKILAKTASPGLKRVTRLPTSTTTPAKSAHRGGQLKLNYGLKHSFRYRDINRIQTGGVNLNEDFVGLEFRQEMSANAVSSDLP